MSSHEAGVAIVGASVAGVRCARTLRSSGYEGRIVLVEAASDEPYDRPALSKQLLVSGGPPPALVTRDALVALAIELRSGVWATGLDPVTGTLWTSTGEDRFDELVVATGAVARTLPGLPDASRVMTLRDLASSRALHARLTSGTRLLVIGGGFIGLEVAAAAVQRGVEVTIVEAGPQVLGRGLPPQVASHLTALHRDRGVDIRTSATVAGAHEGSSHIEVLLADGSQLRADAVVVAVGAQPATDWLAGSGLVLDSGVVCDEQLRAVGADRVSAVGDCANFLNPTYGRRMRLEHWTSAGEQAAFVARRLAGRSRPEGCRVLPYVWSDQYDAHVQIVGVVGKDRLELRNTRAAMAVLECCDENVVGASPVNGQALMLRIRTALRNGRLSLPKLLDSLSSSAVEA